MHKKGYITSFLLGTVAVVTTGVAIPAMSLISLGGLDSSSMTASAVNAQKLERPVVSNINVSCESNTPTAHIQWNTIKGASAYIVSRLSPNKTGWPQIAKISETSYNDSSFTVIPGTYKYQIIATNKSKQSFSDIQTLTVGCGNATSTTATTTATTLKAVANPVATTTKATTTPIATTTQKSITTQPTVPTVTTTPTLPATTQAFNTKEWGVYTGYDDGAMAAFDSLIGKRPNYDAVFIHWGNESSFPAYLAPEVKDKGKTLVIFWENTDYNIASVNQSKYNYDSVIAGNWDSYMTKFAADAKAYGGPVILIPYSEFNGDWFPSAGTQNGNSPEKFITAWKHTKDLFAEASNVKFGWAPNSDSVPDTAANQMERYYPGDAYVDYVGLDGFNDNNPWKTFDQIFGAPLRRIAIYNKPVYIFSFASAPGTKKAAWITDALTVQIPKYNFIKGWIWFNENKENNWLVNSDALSLEAFKAAIK